MFYILFRYLIGAFVLMVMGTSGIIYLVYESSPYVSDFAQREAFKALIKLHFLMCSLLAIVCLGSVVPPFTDGTETLKMNTPLFHPGLMGLLVLTGCTTWIQQDTLHRTAEQTHMFYTTMVSENIDISVMIAFSACIVYFFGFWANKTLATLRVAEDG